MSHIKQAYLDVNDLQGAATAALPPLHVAAAAAAVAAAAQW
jgi:hypothetical protein